MLGRRYLLKDVDTFAGFAHAIHTYLGGVALAIFHNMSLLHRPFQSAHGMGFHFDDFLMGDDRVLAAPLSAPVLGIDQLARLVIDGQPLSIGTVSRTASGTQVSTVLHAAPARSVTLVRKGRFAFVDSDSSLCVNCTITPEARYTALWLRERFWRATRTREQRLAAASTSGDSAKASARPTRRARGASAPGAAPDSPLARDLAAAPANQSVTIAIHVRRGDVTYLDKYSRPSARWVNTIDMLEVLRGVQAALGRRLEEPSVRVHLFSEGRGWGANDTAALRALAPHALVHTDSGPAATIDALVLMSRADLLLMGTSGFSNWAAIFSCGVKIGPAHRPMMPMRHVAYSNTLVARSGPFATAALPKLRSVWESYWRCRQSEQCRPTLCAPEHLSDARWRASSLATEYTSQPLAAQWHVPSVPPLHATPDVAVGRSAVMDGWEEARQECFLSHSDATAVALTSCARSKWSRRLSNSMSLKHRLVAANESRAAAGNRASDKGHGAGGRGGSGKGGGGARAGDTEKGLLSWPAGDVEKARAVSLAGRSQPVKPLPTKAVHRDGQTLLIWDATRMSA